MINKHQNIQIIQMIFQHENWILILVLIWIIIYWLWSYWYTSSINNSLYIQECSFIDCFRSSGGGAIYVNAESNCVLNKICACKCNTDSGYSGQFCCILVKQNSMNMNIAHYVSVCNCSQYENSNIYGSIYFRNGNISLNNMNSSANRCRYHSGVYLYYPTISYTTQSTFSNNTDDHNICIRFYGNSHHMSQCNIIRNH